MAHTPGPWKATRIDYSKRLDVSFEIVSGRELVAQTIMREIATEPERIATDEANVRLIAAAPDMLQALREVAGGCYALDGVALGPRCVFCLMGEFESHDPDCTMQFVKAAIAKAEGR